MIDVGLFIIMVILGVDLFVMGWLFCKIFSYYEADSYNKDEDLVHPCETIEDIIKREG